ncbi:MAG: hypothetical protein ABUL77_04000 [Bacteroidota bacterium]
MLKPCRITFQGMPAVEAAKVEVHAWLQRLAPLTNRMTGGHVVIDAIEERRKERRYQVRMELTMPDQVVVIGHDDPRNAPHEDVHVAIRNAFRAAKAPLAAYCAAQPAVEVVAVQAAIEVAAMQPPVELG